LPLNVSDARSSNIIESLSAARDIALGQAENHRSDYIKGEQYESAGVRVSVRATNQGRIERPALTKA
jgi:hypothetical protein